MSSNERGRVRPERSESEALVTSSKRILSTAFDRLIWDLEDSAQFWERCAADAKKLLSERPRAERRSRQVKIAEDEASALLCRTLIAEIKAKRR